MQMRIFIRNFLEDSGYLTKTLRAMQLTTAFMLAICLQTAARGFSQDITFSGKDVPLDKIFSVIQQQTGYNVSYKSSQVKKAKPVNIDASHLSLQNFLNEVLKNQPFEYVIQINTIFIKRKNEVTVAQNFVAPLVNAPPAEITLRGQVTNAKKEPLQGVSITVKGSSAGTSTDAEGRFQLTVPDGNAELVFSSVGYQAKTIKVGNQTSFAIVLDEAVADLKDVVVVGYGTQKKVNLTGAVEQIGSEYFDQRSLPNATRALQGAIPNLNIKMTDGKPTRTSSFNVRGATSIGAGGSSLILIDGVPGDPNTLNPNDIASVSVLKDAASAAIYGARGSFGVVLITTKNPKKDKVQVTYNGSHSFYSRTTTPDLVTDGYTWAKNFAEQYAGWYDYLSYAPNINGILLFSPEYLTRLKAKHDNPSLPDYGIEPGTGRYEYYSSTDWFKELYNDGNSGFEHSLSLSGGSDKMNYSVSGRYYAQEGIFRYNNDDFKRYNLRIKGGLLVTDWLKLNSITEFSSYKYFYPFVAGETDIWRRITQGSFPVAPMLNPDGTYTVSGYSAVGAMQTKASNTYTKQNYVRNTVGFDAAVIKNKLSLKGDFSYMITTSNETRKQNPVSYSIIPNQFITTTTNRLAQYSQTTNYYVGNIYADYRQRFGNHNVGILAGWNLENEETKSLYADRDGVLTPDGLDFNLATGTNFSLTGGGNNWSTVGLFYRVNYNFKEKYLLEFNGRYDGSSKFPASQQYGFFPSASAGWVVSKEKFMKGTNKWLDNLKFRASYGTLGNGNIAPYTYLQTIGSSRASVIINGAFPNYIQRPSVVSNSLTWEKATTTNFGADIDVLDRRLSLSFDKYSRKTTDMITAGPTLPAVFGASVPRGNNAELITKGWELSLSWHDKIGTTKPLSYSFRFTVADNISKITKFYNPTKSLSDYYEGQTIGEVWGFTTEGLFASQDEITKHADQSFIVVSNSNKLLPGDLKFADLNKDGKINLGKSTLDDPGDLSVIGNTSIRYPYSFTGNVDWNNFSLSFFFQGIGKRDWYPSAEATLFWGQNNRPYNFLPAFTLNRYTDDNPDVNAYFPRGRGYTALSGTRELINKQTRYMQDASYIRLKNLTIGYTMPNSIIKRWRLSELSFYISGENLWTYSPMYKITKNFDPEVIEGSDPETTTGNGDGNLYPMQKAITIGIRISF